MAQYVKGTINQKSLGTIEERKHKDAPKVLHIMIFFCTANKVKINIAPLGA